MNPLPPLNPSKDEQDTALYRWLKELRDVAGSRLPIASGVTTLAAGVSTVSSQLTPATGGIFLTSQSDGGTPGFLRVSARVSGTSFTITSSSNTDTSVVGYVIIPPF